MYVKATLINKHIEGRRGVERGREGEMERAGEDVRGKEKRK